MDKAIVLLTGTSAGKSKFNAIARNTCWVWSASPRDYLSKITANKFYWNGEKDENFFKFMGNLSELVNSSYNLEERYITELIEKFRQTDDEERASYDENGNKTVFTRFLLIIQDISKELTKELEGDEGAFQVHITSKKLQTNPEKHDVVLFEDDADFEDKINHLLNVLLNYKERETV